MFFGIESILVPLHFFLQTLQVDFLDTEVLAIVVDTPRVFDACLFAATTFSLPPFDVLVLHFWEGGLTAFFLEGVFAYSGFLTSLFFLVFR